MKGLIFTEFLELVEREFSVATAETILNDVALTSGGAYTSVGSYDHRELVRLVEALSVRTGIPTPELLRHYGRALFPALVASQPGISLEVTSTFELLRDLDRHIHREVRKLYPAAELPEFEVTESDGTGISVVYRSHRAFADLAHGLIEGSAVYFGETLAIDRRPIAQDGTHEEFRVRHL